MKYPIHPIIKALVIIIVAALLILIITGFFNGLFRGWIGIPLGTFLMFVVLGTLLMLTSALRRDYQKEFGKVANRSPNE